jgi:hypothetical protein
MRVTVGMIVGQIGAGVSIEELLSDYPYLEYEDVMQALRYAAAILNYGMDCLLEKLGVIETEIFISHILREPFDYTAWQKEHYADISVQELNRKAVEYNKSGNAAQ